MPPLIAVVIDSLIFRFELGILRGAFGLPLRTIKREDVLNFFQLVSCTTECERALAPGGLRFDHVHLRSNVTCDLAIRLRLHFGLETSKHRRYDACWPRH